MLHCVGWICKWACGCMDTLVVCVKKLHELSSSSCSIKFGRWSKTLHWSDCACKNLNHFSQLFESILVFQRLSFHKKKYPEILVKSSGFVSGNLLKTKWFLIFPSNAFSYVSKKPIRFQKADAWSVASASFWKDDKISYSLLKFCLHSLDLDIDNKLVRSMYIATLKKLVKLLGKHLLWSTFIVKLPALVMSFKSVFL